MSRAVRKAHHLGGVLTALAVRSLVLVRHSTQESVVERWVALIRVLAENVGMEVRVLVVLAGSASALELLGLVLDDAVRTSLMDLHDRTPLEVPANQRNRHFWVAGVEENSKLVEVDLETPIVLLGHEVEYVPELQ